MRKKESFFLKHIPLTKGINDHLKSFLNHPCIKGMVIKENKKSLFINETYLYFNIILNHGDKKREILLRSSPGSFYQINPEQNQKLVQTVLQLSESNNDETALDIYSGIGNFTIPLSFQTKEIIGIEENRTAVNDSLFNANRNSATNCRFLHGKAEKILPIQAISDPDLVVLDPPRSGLKNIYKPLIALKPQKIIYVSCEPTTFARDVHFLYEKGYSLKKITLIDMFPQTYHMEVVALLK